MQKTRVDIKHNWKKIFIFLLVGILCLIHFATNDVPMTIAQSSVTPTLYCLGSCPEFSSSPSAFPQNVGNGRHMQFPISAKTPVNTNPAEQTAVGQSPCDATQSVRTMTESRRRSKQNGFIGQFIQMLLQLIMQLLQQFFGNSGMPPINFPFPSGTPNNGGTTPSPSTEPGISTSPTPCVSTSTQPTAAPTAVPTISTAPGTTTAPTTAPSGSVPAEQPNGNIPGPWTMTFNDEFNGTALDTTKWTPESKPGNNADETSCFDAANLSVSGGFLNMPLKNQSCQGKQFMGAQIHTTSFAQAYGFFEARMFLPGSNGKTYNFPAFWLLPFSTCWPAGGEMDIMETIGGSAVASYGVGSCDNVSNGWPHADPGGGDWTGWHTFAVDWEPGSWTVYYDGKKVGNSITQNVSSTPMNVLIDQDSRPMGGQTVAGVTLQVDYVRVWKKQ